MILPPFVLKNPIGAPWQWDCANRTTVLRPLLEAQYANIETSQLSRHMWSHAKDLEFENKDRLYHWIRHKYWDIDIVHKSSMVSAMKTAGTKNCALCMQERVKLCYVFNDKANNNKLMNSRRELYRRCTYRTQLLRLSAVGDVGTDETS